MQAHPTAYADINAFLDLLLSQIQLTLGTKLVGLYIFGSLMVGDFDYDSSDIDLVAATSTELDEEEVVHLKRMHEEIAHQEKMWDGRLEVAYISTEALRRYRPDYRHPFISPGEPFHVTEASANWIINRYVLRKKGIVLFGPPPETLVDPITQEELLDALQEFIKEWREWIKHTEVMRPRKYQAYAILTMCRVLYTFKQGEIVSKQRPGRRRNYLSGPRCFDALWCGAMTGTTSKSITMQHCRKQWDLWTSCSLGVRGHDFDGSHNACGLRERVLDYARGLIVRRREGNPIL